MGRILDLTRAGKLTLLDTSHPATLKNHLFSIRAIWYWLVLSLSFASLIAMSTIAEDMFPQTYLRYAFGAIFVFFTPGFSLIKALFPNRELDNFETALASIAASLAVVMVIAFLLNLTPSGINLVAISLSILPFTMISATIGLIRTRK